MGCSTAGGCGSGGCGSGGGCSSTCASRLNVFDWLDNMLPPGEPESNNIYEVRFKSTRKGFYRNVNALDLCTGDMVALESDRGYDIGMITMGGELARLQMRKKRIDVRFVPKIYRLASEDDLQRLEGLRVKEKEALTRARAVIHTMRLNMKISDVEFQADGSKGIFYYTAEQRVDFRELIKALAGEFKVRIEMRQIGLRQEAGLLGGLGSCGRELCCSSWLTEFQSVNTNAARYQNISLNPSKITGLCGRLKCCLNYELETYLDALKDIPEVVEIRTEIGVAMLQKTDIFLRRMWFSYGGDSNWTMLSVEQVTELMALNKQGVYPPSLIAGDAAEGTRKTKSRSGYHDSSEAGLDFVDVVGQSNINERMDKEERNRRKKKKRPADAPTNERRPNENRNADARRPENKPVAENLKTENAAENSSAPNEQPNERNRNDRNRNNRNRNDRRPDKNREPRNTDAAKENNEAGTANTRPPQNRPPQNRPPQNQNRPPQPQNRPPQPPKAEGGETNNPNDGTNNNPNKKKNRRRPKNPNRKPEGPPKE